MVSLPNPTLPPVTMTTLPARLGIAVAGLKEVLKGHIFVKYISKTATGLKMYAVTREEKSIRLERDELCFAVMSEGSVLEKAVSLGTFSPSCIPSSPLFRRRFIDKSPIPQVMFAVCVASIFRDYNYMYSCGVMTQILY